MSEPNTKFLAELLDARRVVFANGDMVRQFCREWIAYKHEGPLNENVEGGAVLVNEFNRPMRFNSLQDAYEALCGDHQLWRDPITTELTT